MSGKDPRAGGDDLFPASWVIGTAAAELARKDGDVLVDPHANQVITGRSGRRPAETGLPPLTAAGAGGARRAARGRRREPTLGDSVPLRPDTGTKAPVTDGAVASEEIEALWSETSRLQRRFASSHEPGVAAVDLSLEPTALDAMRIDADTQAMVQPHHARPGRWFMAVVGSVLIAAAIVMAGKLGLLDIPRAWVQGQIERLAAPAPAANAADRDAGSTAVYSIRREPVSPSE